MKVIYMHHAERKIDDSIDRQMHDITDRGIEEAKNIGERLKGRSDIKAIYTSPYKRCMHTSQIMNEYLDVPIIKDSRFNEKEKTESWKEFLNRNISLLRELDNKYCSNDTIICMTSGVNLSAFICYFYNIKPGNKIPWSQSVSISPINFVSKGSQLD